MRIIDQFQLLGVSHLVVQPNNIKKSLKFYKEVGFKIEFIVKEKIKKKKFFLYNRVPKIAEAYFLKHKNLNMVNIELISHNILDKKTINNFKLTINSPYNLKKRKIFKDPDGNKIILNRTKKFYQELSFKVFNRTKVINYLKKNYLHKYNSYGGNNFNFKSYLNEKWSLKLKLEENKKKQFFYLNNIGLNCISFISVFKKKFKSKNLFLVTKKYKKNKKKKALITFIKSNNFLIEEFFCIKKNK